MKLVDKINKLKKELSKDIQKTEDFNDNEVLKKSQELDKLILEYYKDKNKL